MTATKPSIFKRGLSALLAVTTMLSSGVASAFAVDTTKTATANATLADGEYYVNVTEYNSMELNYLSSVDKWVDVGNLKVENGKYYVTLTYKLNDNFAEKKYDYLLSEKMKHSSYNDYIGRSCGYALGLLPEGYDIDSSPFSKSLKRKIKSDYDSVYDKLTYENVDNKYFKYTFELEPDETGVYINMLYTYYDADRDKLLGFSNEYYLEIDTANVFTVSDDIFTNCDKDMAFNYQELLTKSYYASQGIIQTSTHVTAKNGKLYAKFYYDYDKIKNRCDEMYIGTQLKTRDGEDIVLDSDKSFTIEYSSMDELLNGVPVIAQINGYRGQVIDGEYHKIPYTSDIELNFRLDLAVEPVVLTDAVTGVKVYTTTKYVSKNAVLVSTDVAKDSDAYKTMLEHCKNIYNSMSYKNYIVIDNGTIVENLGTNLIMTFPVAEDMNKLGLSVFFAHYYEEYSFWGWQIYGNDSDSSFNGYLINNDTYMLVTNDITIADYIGFFDKKSASATGENLADGTYTVPITVFNMADPSAT